MEGNLSKAPRQPALRGARDYCQWYHTRIALV